MFEKGDKNVTETYRPVSISQSISKIFERFIFKQIPNFMETFLSKQQLGFRKGYSPKYYLLSMPEKSKSAVNKGKHFGALLIDLSKAFDCLSHELLLFKRHVHGFSLAALRLVHS